MGSKVAKKKNTGNARAQTLDALPSRLKLLPPETCISREETKTH